MAVQTLYLATTYLKFKKFVSDNNYINMVSISSLMDLIENFVTSKPIII